MTHGCCIDEHHEGPDGPGHHTLRRAGGPCVCGRKWTMPVAERDVIAGTAWPTLRPRWFGRIVGPLIGVAG